MAAKKTKFDRISEHIKALVKNDGRFIDLSTYLAEIKRDPSKNPFGTYDLLAEISERILLISTDRTVKEIISDAEEIYKTVVPLGELTPSYEHKNAVFLRIFDKNGIYDSGIFSVRFYSTFSDKNIYLSVMDSLMRVQNTFENFRQITYYANQVRQFFADEQSYGISVVNAAEQMSAAKDMPSVTERLIQTAMRAAGIYDVSEEALERADTNVRDSQRILYETNIKLNSVQKFAQSYKELAESCENSIRALSTAEESRIMNASAAASLDLKRTYEEMVSREQQSIDLDKDKLLREITDSTDAKIRELRILSESLREKTSADLYRINTEANRAAEKAASILNSDELQNIIADLNKNDGLIEKIVRVEEFSRKFDENSLSAPAVIRTSRSDVSPDSTPGRFFEEEPDMTVNPFFDEDIPFSARMDELIRLKQKIMKKNGTLFHERFDDVLTAVIEDANPYLIGPSGCGKTYLAGQIAQLLGMDILDIGYINEEYDLIGFQTASGGYSYPPFYRAYKYGGIVFCDEFDNSNPRAAVKLNSFMSDGENASYCFPNGELVRRHPNFRVIAAGNTSGSGADRNYSTREKIEESVQQRFTSMYLTYDDRMEAQILRPYPQWYDFVTEFRKATDLWSRQNECAAPGVFTTRDAAGIRKYLDHNSFATPEILEYEFIETKENDYLLFITKAMERAFSGSKRKGTEIFGIFSERVAQIVKNGGLR